MKAIKCKAGVAQDSTPFCYVALFVRPGLAQVYPLERQFQWRRNGRTYRISSEVEFGITSLTRK